MGFHISKVEGASGPQKSLGRKRVSLDASDGKFKVKGLLFTCLWCPLVPNQLPSWVLHNSEDWTPHWVLVSGLCRISLHFSCACEFHCLPEPRVLGGYPALVGASQGGRTTLRGRTTLGEPTLGGCPYWHRLSFWVHRPWSPGNATSPVAPSSAQPLSWVRPCLFSPDQYLRVSFASRLAARWSF